jgi:hypothetical protein
MRKVLLASTIALLGFASTAQAHFGLVTPPQVVAQADVSGKGSPPCGPDTGMAATPTPVMGGHAIMLKVTESVPHLGFYRVALALKSRSEFPVDNVVYDSKNKVLPPSGMPNGTSDHAAVQATPMFPVLADGLFINDPHTAAATYMASVMIPNVSCDRCILQVIEFMHPHGFNTSVPGPGGGYFYHHCAELKITPDPALPLFNTGSDGGAPDASSTPDANSTTGGGGSGGAAGGAAGAAGMGAAGATGAAGAMTTGTAGQGGSTASGTAGNPGSGGSTGAAGAVTGAAGAGAAGTGGNHPKSSGGCSIAGGADIAPPALLVLLFGLVLRRRARAS